MIKQQHNTGNLFQGWLRFSRHGAPTPVFPPLIVINCINLPCRPRVQEAAARGRINKTWEM